MRNLSRTVHGTGIFTYIYYKKQLNVGKYTSPKDGMGLSLKIPKSPFEFSREPLDGVLPRHIETHICNLLKVKSCAKDRSFAKEKQW